MTDRRQCCAGEVDSTEAWRLLVETPDAVLVDVRTRPEWSFVGVPDLSAAGKEPILVEWQRFPSMEVDPGFAETLDGRLRAAGAGQSSPILFLCRSGARSLAAAEALAARGYTRCLNVAGGFEGPPDQEGHRGRIDGWKARGLPWRQS